jgi:NitT/TauT family transport system substrate-binding protein
MAIVALFCIYYAQYYCTNVVLYISSLKGGAEGCGLEGPGGGKVEVSGGVKAEVPGVGRPEFSGGVRGAAGAGNGKALPARLSDGELAARKRSRSRKRWAAIAVVVIVAGSALAGYFFLRPAEGDVLRLGYFPNITHAQALVGLEKGTFREHLPGVGLKTYVFNAGPSVIEAMFAGKLDISYIGPSPTINGYVQSKGEALRVVAGACSGGAVLVVRNGSGINSTADLSGKKLGSPQLGNTQDVALRHHLKANGLKTKEEGGSVEVVALPNADILTLFKKGELDGAWVPEPWGARLVHEGGGRIMLDERTLWDNGSFVTANVIVSRKLLDQKPALVRKFVQAHVEATLWIQENPIEAKTVINRQLERLAGKPLANATLDEAFSRLNITYDPVSASLRTYAEWAFELGFLGAARPDLSHLYSLGTLNTILKEKGLGAVK